MKNSNINNEIHLPILIIHANIETRGKKNNDLESYHVTGLKSEETSSSNSFLFIDFTSHTGRYLFY